MTDHAEAAYATGQGLSLDRNRVGSGPTDSVGVVKIAPEETPLQFSWDSLTSATSFQPGLSASGGLASLFVQGLDLAGSVVAGGSPLPFELAGVSIVVNGHPAPILSISSLPGSAGASGHQINFQVPFENGIEPRGGDVEVRYRGMSTYISATVVAPGIFTLADGSPAIQHASDFSLVSPSNPAAPGETIIVYATGLGHIGPGQTGVPPIGPDVIPGCPGAVALFPTKTCPNCAGSILYAGVTPGFVGLYQVNVQVPTNIASGNVDFQLGWNQCFILPVVYGRGNIVKVPIR